MSPASQDTKIMICIHQTNGNDVSGEFRHLFMNRWYAFSSLWDFIFSAEQLWGQLNSPDTSAADQAALLDHPLLECRRGTCATLLLHIRYRQNFSWQGDITWLEKRRSTSFRSVLELMHLITGTFTAPEADVPFKAL